MSDEMHLFMSDLAEALGETIANHPAKPPRYMTKAEVIEAIREMREELEAANKLLAAKEDW